MALDVPWPSDIELEFRTRLDSIEARIAAVEAQNLRTQRLVGELQLEHRRDHREQVAKLDELLMLLRTNGDGHG